MEKNINKIIEEITKAIEEDKFLEDVGNALRGENKEKFNECVRKKLEEIFKPGEGSLLEDFHFFAGGIHYISPSLGDWFRFNFGNKIDLSDKLISDELESAYESIPKEYNLTTWDDLESHVEYLFLETGSEDEDENVFTLNKKMINTLLKYMNLSKKNNKGKSNSTLQKVNYFKYVVGGNYLEDKEKGEKNFSFIENATGFNSSLKTILDNYYDKHLGSKLTEERKKTLCKTGDGNKKYRYDHLFRLLTFSCFFSLMKLGAENLTNAEKENYKFGLVIPFRVHYLDIIKQERLLNYGGFGGIFTRKLSPEEIKSFKFIFEWIINRLISLEMSVLSHKGPVNLIIAEDTIRSCTQIDNKKIENLAKKYSEFFKSVHSKHLEELSGNNRSGFDFGKIIDKEISPNFVGRNEHFIEILERILITLKKEYEENFLKILNKNSKKVKGYCSTIFLYGEEGVGKEVMAKICHIVNPRYYISNYIPKVIKFNFDKHYSEKGDLDDKKTFDEIMKIKNMSTLTEAEKVKIKQIKKEVKKDNPFFNYGNVNMATLDKDTFPKIIFGEKIFFRERDSKSVLSELEIASVLGGTLFLDEIDKLDAKLANQLLKVLEGPYIYQRYGEKKDRHANLLIIFASNKKLEEFTRDTFSSAFIYRIGRNYFEIPPLRTRREDIALLIANSVSKYNEQNEKAKGIKSIDLKGLRLLCELPWLNNYRGLNSFIDTLFIERKIRQINSPEISFDEIVRVVRKLELLKKKSPK